MTTTFTLNGRAASYSCESGESLKTVLRRAGIVSLRNGCDGEGSCGLCAILLDGKLVNSCLILAAEAEGHDIVTIDYYNKDATLRTIQRALIDCACVQCGYCTPAVALSIRELLARSPEPSDEEIADALSGTLCRCTG
jgi:aerobic-type carbon monoxide dehydrogenase small subunit (CoxS/CutS family)